LLRISRTAESPGHVALKVEGVLVAEWVPLLEAECACHLDSRTRVELDFGDVGFIDQQGVKMVRRLVARGVTIVRPKALVQELLGEPDGR
jgi:hypothetical protein